MRLDLYDEETNGWNIIHRGYLLYYLLWHVEDNIKVKAEIIGMMDQYFHQNLTLVQKMDQIQVI
jgi:hypothetical protein